MTEKKTDPRGPACPQPVVIASDVESLPSLELECASVENFKKRSGGAGKETRWVALFDSIHGVLAADRALGGEKIWHDIVPVPRDLSSDCGMALLFRLDDLPLLRSLLDGSSLRPRNVYEPVAGGHRDVSDEFRCSLTEGR